MEDLVGQFYTEVWYKVVIFLLVLVILEHYQSGTLSDILIYIS